MGPNNTYYGGAFSAPPTQTPSKISGRRKPLLIVLGATILLTVILGIVSVTGGGGSGKSDTLLELISAGDGTKSYSLLSKDAQSATSKEQWVPLVVQIKSALGGKEPKLVYSQELNDSQTIRAYDVGEKGSVYRINITYGTKSGLIDAVTYNKTSL